MIKNYFIIAWRTLRKNKVFTFFNLAGLTISLSACMLIYLWVKDELRYDHAAAHADRVYRVALTLQAKNQPDKQFAVTAPPLAGVLVKDIPEIEKAVRITNTNMLVAYRNERFYSSNFYFADSTFFDVFGYPLVKGDPHKVLTQTRAAVISEQVAKKYFGKEDPVGKLITCNDTILLTITGVAKDLPRTNHFHFDVICSFGVLGNNGMNNWWNDSYYTYILVKGGASAFALEKKMSAIMDKYNAEQNAALGFRGLHFLQPLKSIHLYSNLRAEIEPGGSISSLRIFTGIAIFLLLVACINYVNLSTASSFKRSKEIGMRKVTGASFAQLLFQFLSESVLIAVMALLISFGLTQLCLPYFNKLAGTQLELWTQFSISQLLWMIGFAFLLGIIAGLYPALYLSRVKPVLIFNQLTEKKDSLLSLRKLLVVFQFSLCITLIIATVVAMQQLRYMLSQDSGFSKEQVIAIPLRNPAEFNSQDLLKSELVNSGVVSQVSVSSATPGRGLANITVLPEGVPTDQTQTMYTLVVDYNFINTYQLEIVVGRQFSKDFGEDSSSFILNETAVKDLGWRDSENAVGKKFEWGLGKKGKIIGIVKDFHFNALQQKIAPLVMHIQPANSGWYSFLSARIDTRDMQHVITQVRNKWYQLFPGHPFDYFFVDQDYDKQYKTEKTLGNLSAVASIMVICISCLGLLGLVMVAISRRVKEIGIRKVLGASVTGIIALLTKDFLKLVAVAIVVSCPLGWWLMNKWLDDFPYRIQISWWIFILAGIASLAVALVTLSFQAIKAALANPVKSLRTE